MGKILSMLVWSITGRSGTVWAGSYLGTGWQEIQAQGQEGQGQGYGWT